MKKKPIKNYISYTNLSSKDARLFMGANLNEFLNGAYVRLFKKQQNAARPRYCVPDDLKHSKEELDFINSCIAYNLKLIGRHSNARFGTSAQEQHRFFKHPGEQATFLTHLFRGIHTHKGRDVRRRNPKAKNILARTRIDDMHIQQKPLEKKKGNYFSVAGKEVTEKQLYAAGVFYMVELIFSALQSSHAKNIGDPVRIEALFSNLKHFQSGPSYLVAYGRQGGKKSAKARNQKMEKAYQLFLTRNFQQRRGSCKSIARALAPILLRNGVSVSFGTLYKEWLPNFFIKCGVTP